MGDGLPVLIAAMSWRRAGERLATAGAPGPLPRSLRAFPERADRSAARLERTQRADELVGERRDRTQKSIGLHAADEQAEKDQRSDDTGDGTALHPPALRRGAEDRDRRAQLSDEHEQRGQYERRPERARVGERDELDEEVAGERDEWRGADHREATDDERERGERGDGRARTIGAGPPLDRARGDELLGRGGAGHQGDRDRPD